MIKKSVVKASALAALLVGAMATSSAALAHPADDSVYALDGRKNVVRSGANLCWRDGYWTPAAAAKDKNGCTCDKELLGSQCGKAPSKPKPQQPKVSSFEADALFAFNSSRLSARGKRSLDKFVRDSNRGNNSRYLVITGHADRIGKASSNMRLSQRRAAAVKNHLIRKGVAAGKMFTVGRGETESDASSACRNLGRESARNRRLVACLGQFRRVDVTETNVKPNLVQEAVDAVKRGAKKLYRKGVESLR